MTKKLLSKQTHWRTQKHLSSFDYPEHTAGQCLVCPVCQASLDEYGTQQCHLVFFASWLIATMSLICATHWNCALPQQMIFKKRYDCFLLLHFVSSLHPLCHNDHRNRYRRGWATSSSLGPWGVRVVPYGVFNLHWKSELGARNNVTPKLSAPNASQPHKRKNKTCNYFLREKQIAWILCLAGEINPTFRVGDPTSRGVLIKILTWSTEILTFVHNWNAPLVVAHKRQALNARCM